jgi:ABC-type transport system substrate-binding protein
MYRRGKGQFPLITIPGTMTFFVSCCLLVFFFSCSHQNRREGYVYYRLNTNPTTLDPALIVDVTGGVIAAKLFNGLVRLDENLNIIPDIAEKWTISPDGLIYTFSVKKYITYINKQYVKAGDIKYSFKRILDPRTRSPNTWVLDKIMGADGFMKGRADDVSGIRVVDDYTLEIKLEKPFSAFLYLLTMSAAYIVPEDEVKRWGLDFSSNPVGTGPFILKQWLPNRELILEQRDDYFDRKANIRGVVYRIIPEDLTAMTEFELGNIDVISVPAPEFSKYMKDPKWKDRIESVRGINTYYIGLNCSRPPFQNPELRRAMNMAIDRTKLLSTFYEKRGRIATGPVPDLLRKWDTPPPYDYNPGMAREIVGKEGLTGSTVHFYITADQEVVDMAEFIQSYLNRTGLNVKITQLEWSAYKDAINKGVPDMFWLSWWADYPDPEDFLFPLFHSSNRGPAGNRARYSNPEVDRYIERGQTTRDVRERNALYKKAEDLIVRDAPWVFFWHKNDYIMRQPWIRNYRTYPIYSMDKGTEISF